MIAATSLACTALIASCGTKKASEETPAMASLSISTGAFGEETDTLQFPIDENGYIVIFDGNEAPGWRGYGKDHKQDRWTVEDSCLHFVRGEGEGGDIIFAHKFDNFDVTFDWKVSEGANSGFFYLGEETRDANGNLNAIYMSAPEYQILDNVNHPDAAMGVDGNRKSASLYDMIPANPQNSKPWGEWNTSRVQVKDGKVTHWQNGEVVLTYELWTPEWTEMLQNSKFSAERWPSAFELLNAKHSGHLGFQDHGDEVWFKNIRVKEL